VTTFIITIVLAISVSVALILAVDWALEWWDRRQDRACSHYSRCPECEPEPLGNLDRWDRGQR
jgi:hypothetical protein